MTDDDEILRALGARARAQEAEPTPEGVPPFDAAAEERIAARLLGSSAPSAPSAPKPKPKPQPETVRWLWGVLPLAAAAALFILFAWPDLSTSSKEAPEYASLVSANEMRAPVTATANSEVTVDPEGGAGLVARPAVPVKGARARAFLTHSGDTKPWAIPIDVSDEGAVKISGPTRTLFPEVTGTYGILLIVGVGERMPTDDEVRALANGAAPPPNAGKYRALRAQARFVEKK